MTSTPEAVVRRLIEQGFNEGDLDVADELTSPDLVEHQNFGPDHAPGAEGVKAVIASLRRAFSDFQGMGWSRSQFTMNVELSYWKRWRSRTTAGGTCLRSIRSR